MDTISVISESKSGPFQKFITFLKALVLTLLQLGTFWALGMVREVTMGMNVEMPLATQLSLGLVDSKLLLVIFIIGSGIICLNEFKNPNLVQRDNITQVIYIGLVLLHIATIFFMLNVFMKLVNAT